MTNEGRILDDQGLDILFRQARTFRKWQEKEVSDVLLQALYDLLKWGPTSSNCCPARFVFVRSAAEKERLKPCLTEGNVAQTMSAPVTAIIAYDLDFYGQLPRLSPHNNAQSWFEGKPDFTRETAFRNGSLQGAYMMLAARALGLDCGPMSGFKKKALKEAFFPNDNVEPNFLCNIGYGDPEGLYDRAPRLNFDEACRII